MALLKFTLGTTGDDENDGTKGVTHATSKQHLATGCIRGKITCSVVKMLKTRFQTIRGHSCTVRCRQGKDGTKFLAVHHK